MVSGIKLKRRALVRLGETLTSEGVITEDQLKVALERQRQTGEFLGESLVTLGFANGAILGPYLEAATGFPFVDLGEQTLDIELARRIPEALARSKRVVPFKQDDRAVYVAMADPLNLVTVDQLKATLGREIIPCLAFAYDVEESLRRTYDVRHKAQSVIEEIIPLRANQLEDSLDALIGQAQDAPIVRLVNSIVHSALTVDASDIHIEPQEEDVRVRYRIDGLLYEQMSIPSGHLAAVVSRLKIMSNLDISERRRPQDGRFTTRDEGGRDFDVRLSIMPTVYGEKAVMRLLEKSASLGSVDKLGFFPDQREQFLNFIHRPYGIILVTGPTGSGKSTTLYAGLHQINDSTRNINTVEDPVEYKLKGVNQVQVNPKIGVTFSAGLRTLVRQDPDVILVGEIRDFETAEIAVQAALTGHLVLSTLHTNDAPGALVRLQNMGVEPFLVSSAVLGVIGQRLVRTLCTGCRELYDPSEEVVRALQIPDDVPRPIRLARGRGCRRCGNRGMKGRTAVYEVMPMSDQIRDAVLRKSAGSEIAAIARTQGMRTMRENGLQKVLSHQVAPEEVMRVLSQEE